MEHGSDLDARVPAADDQHRRRHLGQLPGVAVRVGELDAGNGESSADAPGAEDELRRFKPKSAFGLDRVRAGEAGRARLLVDCHAERIGLLAQGRVRAYAVYHLAHARQQPVELHRGLAGRDAVSGQLSRIVHQPRCIGQRPHRHGPIVGGHSAELRGGHDSRARAELRRTDRRERSGRTGADHDDVVGVPAGLGGMGMGQGPARIQKPPTATATREERPRNVPCARGLLTPGRPAIQPTSDENVPIAATLPIPKRRRYDPAAKVRRQCERRQHAEQMGAAGQAMQRSHPKSRMTVGVRFPRPQPRRRAGPRHADSPDSDPDQGQPHQALAPGGHGFDRQRFAHRQHQ